MNSMGIGVGKTSGSIVVVFLGDAGSRDIPELCLQQSSGKVNGNGDQAVVKAIWLGRKQMPAISSI